MLQEIVMKKICGFVFVIALLMPVAFADDITNLLGTVYQNVKITRVEPDSITVMHSGGIAKLFFEELPEDIQQRFRYDPARAFRHRQSVQQAKAQQAQAAKARSNLQQTPDFPVSVFDIIAVKDKSVKEISGVSAYLTDPSITGQGQTILRPVKGGLYRIRFNIRNKTQEDLRALIRFGDFQKTVFVAAGREKRGEEISGNEEYSEMFVIVKGKEKAFPLQWRKR